MEQGYPAYRLIDGLLTRQLEPGGDWEPLEAREANALLARLDGIRIPASTATPAARPDTQERAG